MDLPEPITRKPFSNIKHLCEKSKVMAEQLMQEAVIRVYNITAEEEPENVIMTSYGELACVSVTVDGTWQRRGHSSKFGVVFVMSARTGEVLDNALRSIFCHECVVHENDDKYCNAYKKWKGDIEKCCINHVGSADSMEKKGAVEIFLRSVETRRQLYKIFTGDGDTGSFGYVRDACLNRFGDMYSIQKEECVGHIQKRMGSGLREYKRKMRSIKLKDNKTVGGAGRLTDKL